MPFDRTESRQQESVNLIKDDRNDKLDETRQELRVVTINTVKNVGTIAERGENLDVLNNQTAALAESSSQFKRQATDVKSRMRRKHRKMKIIWAVGIIIVVSLAVAFGVAVLGP
ncbi:hypothetical protein VCV18_007637 [Metarhizium anisopliae]